MAFAWRLHNWLWRNTNLMTDMHVLDQVTVLFLCIYKEGVNVRWKGMPVLPKLLVSLVNSYPFKITPPALIGGELLLQEGAPPFLPPFPFSFFQNLPWWRTSGQALLEAPRWAMNCTKFSLSKALLGHSYAGVHCSYFSLYFLLTLVNRTPWVIYIPFKLIGEWSQMNNYLNFLFCPEGVI